MHPFDAAYLQGRKHSISRFFTPGPNPRLLPQHHTSLPRTGNTRTPQRGGVSPQPNGAFLGDGARLIQTLESTFRKLISLEATASRLEAITVSLESTAIGLEAIKGSSSLVAMASKTFRKLIVQGLTHIRTAALDLCKRREAASMRDLCASARFRST